MMTNPATCHPGRPSTQVIPCWERSARRKLSSSLVRPTYHPLPDPRRKPFDVNFLKLFSISKLFDVPWRWHSQPRWRPGWPRRHRCQWPRSVCSTCRRSSTRRPRKQETLEVEIILAEELWLKGVWHESVWTLVIYWHFLAKNFLSLIIFFVCFFLFQTWIANRNLAGIVDLSVCAVQVVPP